MSDRDELEEGMAAYNHGDYAMALRALAPLAEKGIAEAQCMIASIYHLGLGVSTDGAEAVKWYRRAAEQGHPVAYNNLGSIYRTGMLGVSIDHQKAKECYRKAVECGFEMIPKDWYE